MAKALKDQEELSDSDEQCLDCKGNLVIKKKNGKTIIKDAEGNKKVTDKDGKVTTENAEG